MAAAAHLEKVCSRCEEKFDPFERFVISREDLPYHERCFVCDSPDCRVEITGAYASKLLEGGRKEELFCSEHAYLAVKDTLPVCRDCGKLISSGTYLTVMLGVDAAAESHFHKECFRCTRCSNAITKYLMMYGRHYCETCGSVQERELWDIPAGGDLCLLEEPASINCIIRQLTQPDGPAKTTVDEHQLRLSWVFSFDTFLEPLTFLELLVRRWNVSPERDLTGSEAVDWRKSVQEPVRARCVALLKAWMEVRPDIWAADESLVARSTEVFASAIDETVRANKDANRLRWVEEAPPGVADLLSPNETLVYWDNVIKLRRGSLKTRLLVLSADPLKLRYISAKQKTIKGEIPLSTERLVIELNGRDLLLHVIFEPGQNEESERTFTLRTPTVTAAKIWKEKLEQLLFSQALRSKLHPDMAGIAMEGRRRTRHTTGIFRRQVGEVLKRNSQSDLKRGTLRGSVAEASVAGPKDPLELSNEELAGQLTKIDWDSFLKVVPSEFGNQRWAKPHLAAEKAPNLLAMIERSNAMSWWVAGQVLHATPAGLETRVRMVHRFIEVAKFLVEKHGNFHGALAVVSGLSTSPISRLHATWAKLSSGDRRSLSHLEKLFAADMSYRAYRTRIESTVDSKQGGIPALSVHLSDLVMIDENSDETQGKLNFSKLDLLSKVISLVLTMQSSVGPTRLLAIEPAASQLSTPAFLSPLFSEKALYDRSLECEPRTAT